MTASTPILSVLASCFWGIGIGALCGMAGGLLTMLGRELTRRARIERARERRAHAAKPPHRLPRVLAAGRTPAKAHRVIEKAHRSHSFLFAGHRS